MIAPVNVIPPPSAPPPSGRATTLAERIDAMLDAAVEEESGAEVVRRTSGGFAIPMEAILAAGGEPDVTAPMTVHEVPTRPVDAVTIQPRRREERRMSADAGGLEAIVERRQGRAPPPPPRTRTSRGSEPPIPIDDGDILEAGEPALAIGEESGAHDPFASDVPLVEGTEGSFNRGSTPVPEMRDAWDAPAMPAREPTMILSEPAIEMVPPPVAPPVIVSTVEGGAGDDDEELDPMEDLADVSASRPVMPSVSNLPPTGGDFGRELRKKMSAMAQRLFRQGDATAPVDTRPPHDYRTEIDLAAIDEAGGATGGAVYDLQAEATFSGDDHGLPTSVGHLGHDSGPGTSGTASARTSRVRRRYARHQRRRRADRAHVHHRVHRPRQLPARHRREGRLLRPRAPGVRVLEPARGSHGRAARPRGQDHRVAVRAAARPSSRESGRRMGEILVDFGYLKRRELLPAVRRHVEDIIYSLFGWDRGHYHIAPATARRPSASGCRATRRR